MHPCRQVAVKAAIAVNAQCQNLAQALDRFIGLKTAVVVQPGIGASKRALNKFDPLRMAHVRQAQACKQVIAARHAGAENKLAVASHEHQRDLSSDGQLQGLAELQADTAQ